MNISDAISLINHPYVTRNLPEIWADLGCGAGTFTEALSNILPENSEIIAIDKSQQKLPLSYQNSVKIAFLHSDFEKEELQLPSLDGILMANSIHYVKNKSELLKRLITLFKERPKFLLVEYDTSSANPWVPFPLPFSELKKLIDDVGLTSIEKIGERNSLYGEKMYSALIS
jgi:ubiquinone/menaquinone biosynthesis C-methylase UbiE